MLFALERLLRLLHPLVPFVTEELWQQVAPKLGIEGDTIMIQPYPQAGEIDVSAYAQSDVDVEWLKSMVSALRRVRSELGVSPSKQVRLLVRGGGEVECARLGRFDAALKFLSRIEAIEVLQGEPPASAAARVGELDLFVPLDGLVDLGTERSRIDKELNKIEAELAKSTNKLASDTFVANAPAAVVEQERTRLAEWTSQIAALTAQRERLG